jgi:hypothetical protein
MASNIISTTIDEEYPVAGQDNDSQGFRDNFSIIKTGLTTAKDEITDLQATRARLDQDNDFNGNNIQEANFLMTTEEVRNNGALTASQNISFESGHYQTVQVGGDITLTLSDWPTSGVMGRIRLLITKDNNATSRTITWSVGGGGSLKTNSTWPGTFTLTQTNFQEPVVVDFWTSDGGVIVYGLYHGAFSA